MRPYYKKPYKELLFGGRMGRAMRRLCLFLIMLCMFGISANLKKLDLHQQRRDAMEHLLLLRSAEVSLEIPLAGNITWGDMLGKD